MSVVAVSITGAGLASMAAALLVLRRRLELVARAEHELRGPATVLALACERMRRDEAAARHAELLEVQLDRLMAGLEDLAAGRRGQRSPTTAGPVELAAFARAALAPWEHLLGRDGRGATVVWEASCVARRIDRGRLSKALCNLLANAAEHGAGDVELRGRRSAGGIRLEVRNRERSAGASGDEAETAARPRRNGGRGLAIAGQAARELGGRLEVRSRDGSVVAALELPDGPPSANPRAA